jgi:hypothetical protein
MNHSEKLNLKQLTDTSDYVDNTEQIRKVKHSTSIRDAVRTIENLKTNYAELKKNNFVEFMELCKNEARFLYDNYTDIFNKLLKDEIDLTIMTKLLTVLKLIEDGKIDQNDGSIMVGKILKELYVDSALKRANNLDNEHQVDETQKVEPKEISWKQYAGNLRSSEIPLNGRFPDPCTNPPLSKL